MTYLIIKLALFFIVFRYSKVIVQDKYSSTTYEKVTDWLIYLVSAATLIGLSIYAEMSLLSFIITGLIVGQSVLILINTYKSVQVSRIIDPIILILILLSFIMSYV